MADMVRTQRMTETTDPLEQSVMEAAEVYRDPAMRLLSPDLQQSNGACEWAEDKARERLRLHVQLFAFQSRLKEHEDSLTTCLYDHSTPVSCPRQAWLKHEIAALEARAQED